MSLPRYELLLGTPMEASFTRRPRNMRHRSDFFEPCYVVSGSGDFWHGDEHFPLRKGDLFIAKPGVFHEITSLETQDLQLFFTTFALAEARGKTTGNPFQDETVWQFVKGHRLIARGQLQIADMFRCLFSMTKSSRLAKRPFFLKEQMRLLILQVMAVLGGAGEEHAGGNQSDKLESVLQRIDIRLADPPRVGELAKSCGMSERSLRRLFHDKLGRSVSAEIRERRIRNAVSLLPLRELTIASIGEQVGIKDAGQFSRLFKKIVGISPRDFRMGGLPSGEFLTWRANVGEVQMRTEVARNQTRGVVR